MSDLSHLTARDATELGSSLRRIGEGAHSMEEVANRIVRHLVANLVSRETGEPDCALVRFFKTHALDELEDGLREFAMARLRGRPYSPSTRCLTLLATAGDRPEWNSRSRSLGHKALPLVSPETVAQAPMIASLLRQLGVEIGPLLRPRPGLLVETRPSSFNAFYVPRALGSPDIPAQRDFVIPARIESVLGFGGLLPLGDIFVVILFSKVHVPRETAELCENLALNVKLAVLPFEETVFADERSGAATERGTRSVLRLLARIDTLEQLLEVHERRLVGSEKHLEAKAGSEDAEPRPD